MADFAAGSTRPKEPKLPAVLGAAPDHKTGFLFDELLAISLSFEADGAYLIDIVMVFPFHFI